MESSMVPVLKLIAKTAALGAVTLGMVSCATLPANTNDIARLERKLDAIGETVESNNRQTRGEIGTLNNNLESNTSQLRASVDDISKQMEQQRKDIAELRDRVQTPTPTPAPTQPMTNPGGFGTPGQAPAAQPTDFLSALNAGKQAFSQQNYPAARESFNAALNFANGDAATNPEKGKSELVQANYWVGEAAFAARDFPAAEQAYRAVIKLDKKSINAWQSYERLGDIDVANGNNTGALQKYQAILDAWKGQRYEGASQILAKIAQIQQGGAAAAPAPGQQAPAPGGTLPEFGQGGGQ